MANLLTSPEDFTAAAWENGQTGESADAVTAPDGTTTADKIYETGATATHFHTQDVSVTSGLEYTFSCFFKASEESIIQLYLLDNYFPAQSAANFDISSGIVTLEGAGASGSGIDKYASGFYRGWVTATADVTGSNNAAVIAHINSPTATALPTYAGTNLNGVYAWGAYLNTGNTPETYVSVGGTTVEPITGTPIITRNVTRDVSSDVTRDLINH